MSSPTPPEITMRLSIFVFGGNIVFLPYLDPKVIVLYSFGSILGTRGFKKRHRSIFTLREKIEVTNNSMLVITTPPYLEKDN
jgi:hypothetical protein